MAPSGLAIGVIPLADVGNCGYLTEGFCQGARGEASWVEAMVLMVLMGTDGCVAGVLTWLPMVLEPNLA